MPEKPEGDKSKEPEKSRRATLGDTIEMPPCDGGYLVGYLFEVGPTMGESPVTHTEIESWQRNTGIELNSWEARTVRSLSIAYMNESHKATKRDCPAPYAPADMSQDSRDAVALGIKNMMQSYMMAAK